MTERTAAGTAPEDKTEASREGSGAPPPPRDASDERKREPGSADPGGIGRRLASGADALRGVVERKGQQARQATVKRTFNSMLAHHPDHASEPEGLAGFIAHSQDVTNAVLAITTAGLSGFGKGRKPRERGETGAATAEAAAAPEPAPSPTGGSQMAIPRQGKNYDLADPSALGRLRAAVRRDSKLPDDAFEKAFSVEAKASEEGKAPFHVRESAFDLKLDAEVIRRLQPRSWSTEERARATSDNARWDDVPETKPTPQRRAQRTGGMER